ncbi:MAG: FtsX-like permease family protein, partial [Gammaproteobacteria bacterium]
RVVVMSQTPDNDIADRGFRVVGVFEAALRATEEQRVYAGRETLRTLLGTPGTVSQVAALGADYRDVSDLEALLSRAAPADTAVLTWMALDPYLGMMMKLMDGFVLVWMVVIFLALSFGLVNTMMMAVFERVREIGLMQALGLKPAAIVWLVLLESLFLIAAGLVVGNLLAIATILPLRDGIDLGAVAQGMEMMGAAPVLQPALKVRDLALANAVVLVLGVITSMLPAWRAARYRPVDAIART